MTQGQERALRELQRLHAAFPDGFEVLGEPQIIKGYVILGVSLRLGLLETRPGGLELREREDFQLFIPNEFPFQKPTLFVTDPSRYAGFAHVIWSNWICLYQGESQWNPSDGMYGFFDRLVLWLGRAARNDMDPPGGPVEPPHHITDSSQPPFLIRCNAPVEAGTSWIGLAELEKFSNRTEVVAWNDLSKGWPEGRQVALAVMLPGSLPLEFPKMGADFFKELEKQGIDREKILGHLGIASFLTPKGEPIQIILGLPMRRTADGLPRLHITVWSTGSEFSESLHLALPEVTDSEKIKSIRQEFANSLYALFEKTQIKWCRVMEARSEIIVRRDKGSPISWCSGKRILILGCGALGSWAAEIIARASPHSINLVDSAEVGPGILARQNYRTDDIGAKKVDALAKRLKEITVGVDVKAFSREAHGFLIENAKTLSEYDLILDCTASVNFQMRLERDWQVFGRRTPPIISLVIDFTAQRALCVMVDSNSTAGIWDAYIQLKHKLCLEPACAGIASAFYADRARENMFQPEPGCSDPTFIGSTADVCSLTSIGLNITIPNLPSANPLGFAFSTHSMPDLQGSCYRFELANMHEVTVGPYRARITPSVYSEAKEWVRQNNRKRSRNYETGGLLWGLWDDAVGVIWLFEASGPPPDSLHGRGRFVCGTKGTTTKHKARLARSHGTCGFVGFWHTHPDMPSNQSIVDISGMTGLVSRVGQNQKRAVMLIFGRSRTNPTAGFYAYESHSLSNKGELISVGAKQIRLEQGVV